MFSSRLASKRLVPTALFAALGLAFPSLAQDCRLWIRPSQPSVRSGESLGVVVGGSFDPAAYAFASSLFRVHASEGKWGGPTAGVPAGNQVLGIQAQQSHAPWLGAPASPANPIKLWSASFTPDGRGPRIVELGAYPTDFWVYPSPLTLSPVPCSADAGKTWVLVDPLRFGAAEVAPGGGTTIRPLGPDRFEAHSARQSAVLIALLLPAVQPGRESLDWSFPGTGGPTRLGMELEYPSRAGDSASFSLNFTKITTNQIDFDSRSREGEPVEVRVRQGRAGGANFLFADGSVRFVTSTFPSDSSLRIVEEPTTGRSFVAFELGFRGGVSVAVGSSAPIAADVIELRFRTDVRSRTDAEATHFAQRLEVEGSPYLQLAVMR